MHHKEHSEDSVMQCMRHCLKLIYSKMTNFYNRWESKVVKYALILITGVSPAILLFFMITSRIPLSVTDPIEKSLDNNYCLEDMGSSGVNRPFETQMYFYWDRPCFNISLSAYDADYKDYELVISRIFYETKGTWNGDRYVSSKIPEMAYGILRTPKYEYQGINHIEQKFILTNTTLEQIELYGKEGKVKLSGFVTYDNNEQFIMQFTHSISLWDWFLRYTHIKKI